MNQGLVLIADDDPEFIAELAKILIDRGYLVLGAKDGQAAADLLNKHQLQFSLAIVDVFMPMIGGFELIRRLAEDKAKLKIIAVSKGRQKVLEAAISLGADAGVKKPESGTPLDAAQWLNEVFLQIGLPAS